MPIAKVHADYQRLTEKAQAFGQQVESARQMLGTLQKNMDTLQGGRTDARVRVVHFDDPVDVPCADRAVFETGDGLTLQCAIERARHGSAGSHQRGSN